MKVFNSTHNCIKCCSDDIHTYWCKGERKTCYDICYEVKKEHMHRRCRRCGYEWLEKPCDAKETE